MRPVRLVCLVAISMAVAIHGSRIPAVQAQSSSVKAIFEKYNLLGIFAWDCGKLASRDNLYYVNRVVTPDLVQRDEMDGQTSRRWFTFLDKATETGSNEIRVSGRLTGTIGGKNIVDQPVDGIWRIEQNRMLQWESTLAGKPMIGGGRLIANGMQMPWQNKCDGR